MEHEHDQSSIPTPGPWRHAGHGHIWATDTASRHESSVVRVAIVGAFHDAELLPFSRERWTADARLIAAAPLLLEALKFHINKNGHTANCTQITSSAYPCSKRCRLTRDAIAAATPPPSATVEP